jgi:hypothetical protein
MKTQRQTQTQQKPRQPQRQRARRRRQQERTWRPPGRKLAQAPKRAQIVSAFHLRSFLTRVVLSSSRVFRAPCASPCRFPCAVPSTRGATNGIPRRGEAVHGNKTQDTRQSKRGGETRKGLNLPPSQADGTTRNGLRNAPCGRQLKHKPVASGVGQDEGTVGQDKHATHVSRTVCARPSSLSFVLCLLRARGCPPPPRGTALWSVAVPCDVPCKGSTAAHTSLRRAGRRDRSMACVSCVCVGWGVRSALQERRLSACQRGEEKRTAAQRRPAAGPRGEEGTAA